MRKGNYVIALYDAKTTEECYGIFETPNEMADYLNEPIGSIYCMISRMFTHKENYVQHAVNTKRGKAIPFLIDVR